MDIQTIYQDSIKFAALKHSAENQTVPGTKLPYIVHLSNVAMEVMLAYAQASAFELGFAVQLALLHDTLEDTAATFEALSTEFGLEVAQGVSALTKNKGLPKEQQMPDSLSRIKALPKEVGLVKLADRITNLQEPPKHWDKHKKEAYQKEALDILKNLKGSNRYLEQRLNQKIREYERFII